MSVWWTETQAGSSTRVEALTQPRPICSRRSKEAGMLQGLGEGEMRWGVGHGA